MKHPFLFALVLMACARPPDSVGTLSESEGPAPTELAPLTNYLFRVHASDDEAAIGAGLSHLEAWIAQFANGGRGLTHATSLGDRSWTLAALSEADVQDLPARPDRPLRNLLASGVAYVSEQSIACHAAVQAGSEIAPLEATAKTYTRNFLGGIDPECFVAAACERMRTQNMVLRKSQIFQAELELFKNFRWVTYEHEGAPRRAFVSRGWIERSSDCDDGAGGNQLWQSFGMEVWIDRGADVLRYQVTWSESELYFAGIGVDDNTQLSQVASTSEGVLTATERYITSTLKPQGRCQ